MIAHQLHSIFLVRENIRIVEHFARTDSNISKVLFRKDGNEAMNIDKIMQTIGQNIKRYRKRLNLTQKQLSEKMSTTTSSTSISNYENSKRDNITLSTLVDFAQALEVDPIDLLVPLKSESEFKEYSESLDQIIQDDNLCLCTDELRILEQVTGGEKTKRDYLLILTVLRYINGGDYKVVLDKLINYCNGK